MEEPPVNTILIIQTAHMGDVILALPVAQRLHRQFPQATVHFLVRKGNEKLLHHHPAIDHIHIWDKTRNKTANLLKLTGELRRQRFDLAVNLQRFFSSGLIMAAVPAKVKVGFDKNPLSFFYDRKMPHRIPRQPTGDYLHEVERNLSVLRDFAPTAIERPRLYPGPADWEKVAPHVQQRPYFVIAPASVWFTKQWPPERWRELARALPAGSPVYLIGSPADSPLADKVANGLSNAVNLCGEFSLLQSAALMKEAERVFVNDSAPMHLASAMNAPVTVVYCSTMPAFGFGPLADDSHIIEASDPLQCRPCGLHGHRACPKGHFKCARFIEVEQVLATLKAKA